jgi:hypothetical protein
MSKTSKSQWDFGESFPTTPKRPPRAFKSAPWPRTRERLEIIRKNLDKSDLEIGRILGVTRAAVNDLRARFGIAKERGDTQRKERFINLVRKMPSSLTPREMALKLELPEGRTYYYGHLAGYRFPSRREKTDRHWKGRLKSLPPGLTLGMVAGRLGVSYGYGLLLCQRHRYKVRHAGSSKPPRVPERR